MKKENLKFDAEITFETEKIEAVYCEIFFPKTQDEEALIVAQLNLDKSSVSKIPRIFALNATIFDTQGNLLSSISASRVYNLEISTSYYDANRSISILQAKPVDLKVCHFFKQTDHQEKTFYFWLTQSILLEPDYSVNLYCNGNINVDVSNSKKFEILEGLQFKFVDYYIHHIDPERKNIRLSRSILAAEFIGVTNRELGETTFPDMEMFLKLVSFAERRRIVCYGYQGTSNGRRTDFYRGDISIPKEDFGHSFNETLIDVEDFQDFILQALTNAKTCIFGGHLFDAIGKVAYRENSTLESEYLSYYSALENLVNGYCDAFSSHHILENDSWKKFAEDLKNFIRKHDFFKDEENQESRKVRNRNRQLMYEKLGPNSGLNRVSFGTAFKSFCDYYSIDLSDLWGIGGGKDQKTSTSLSSIRNRLIHGGRFKKEEYEAVICARKHLKWTLERCILRVLGWDIEKSRVRATFLKLCSDYSEWREKLSSLKND